MTGRAAGGPGRRRTAPHRAHRCRIDRRLGPAHRLQAPGTDRLQAAWFDAYQALAPRQVRLLPVTVVEIDQKSLVALGQWPWPRTQLARLVNTINRAEPAAIGLNIMMPEADALSPERLLADATVSDRSVASALRSLMSNDAVLAGALALAPAVLVFAGTDEETETPLRAAPVTVQAKRLGSDVDLAMPQYAGALTSIDELNRQASGWGLMSADTTRGIVRRIPLVASIQGTLVPTLAVEMLRVAYHAPSVQLTAAGRSVTGLTVGQTHVRTERDGAVRVYFSRHRADRFVSAVDVLEGKVDPALLRQQLVLIGLTALGVQEFQDTPIGDRMSGSEIQAQLLENLLDGTLLRRPSWAPGVEALLVLALRRAADLGHDAPAAVQCRLAVAPARRSAGAVRLQRLSLGRPAAGRGDAGTEPGGAVRRLAGVCAGRVDPAAKVARRGRARPSASRAHASPANSKRRSASRPPACRASTSSMAMSAPISMPR